MHTKLIFKVKIEIMFKKSISLKIPVYSRIMTNRYQTGKVYRLLCEDGHYYIGSTTQALNLRFNTHKTLSKTKKERVYEHIHTIGWDKIIIELLEDCPCTTKEELNNKEKEYRSLSKSDPLCLNDSCDIIDIDSNNQTMYRNGKIYRLLCEDGHYYIGSTVSNLANCIANHRQYSAIYPNEHPYDYIATIGWDKVRIELIEHYSCYSKDELDKQKELRVNNVGDDILCLNHIDKWLVHESNDMIEYSDDIDGDFKKDIDDDIDNTNDIDDIDGDFKEDTDYDIDNTNDIDDIVDDIEDSEDMKDLDESNDTEDTNTKYTNGKIYRLVCTDGHYYYGSTTTTLSNRFGCHKHAIKNNTHGGHYFYFALVPLDTISIELVKEYKCNSRKELLQKENEYIIAHKEDPFCLNTYQSFQSEDDKKEYMKRYYEKNPIKVEYTKSQLEAANKRTKEYRAKNRDEILKREAAYREANRALLSEKQKEYKKKHAEQVKLAQEQYRESHKEQYKEYFKAYRKANQERIQAQQKIWNHKKKEENAEKIALEREERRAAKKEQSKLRIQKDREIHICECGGSYQFYQRNRHMLSKKHETFTNTREKTTS